MVDDGGEHHRTYGHLPWTNADGWAGDRFRACRDRCIQEQGYDGAGVTEQRSSARRERNAGLNCGTDRPFDQAFPDLIVGIRDTRREWEEPLGERESARGYRKPERVGIGPEQEEPISSGVPPRV
jgi:hypothetical protein